MRYGPEDKLIDIPQRVIDALAEGKLAIFAGSGVSCDAPSKCPDFVGLAKEAKDTFGSIDDKYQPVDEYFGRLDQSHPNQVHEWLKKRFAGENSQHNEHHSALMRIFKDSNTVRIVTTNYDNYLTQAAGLVFAESAEPVEEHYAPALPEGDDFFGLVYLHGSARKRAKHLILTDADFGTAYITKQWASTFLKDLFRTYTVLFVGYSCSDPILRYFLRGLQHERYEAYAFSCEVNQTKRWEQLRVQPITYKSDGNHSALWTAVEDWIRKPTPSALELERTARSILTNHPPLSDSPDNLFLVTIFKHPKRISFFSDMAMYGTGSNGLIAKGWLAPPLIFMPRQTNTFARSASGWRGRWWLPLMTRRCGCSSSTGRSAVRACEAPCYGK
jgi:hypothetical protein